MATSAQSTAPPDMAYEDRIRAAYAQLSPSFQKLADFLLDEYDEAAFLTGTQLAQRLDLDPATVVRFAQRLGYPGYPELQSEVQGKVRMALETEVSEDGNTPAGAVDQALQNAVTVLERTRRGFPLEGARALVRALDESTRVIFLAEGPSHPIAGSLAGWLEAGGYSIHISGGSPAELARTLAGVRGEDLVLAIELARGTPTISRALERARALGAKTVALVAAPSLESSKHADIVLSAHPSDDPWLGQLTVYSMAYGLARLLRQSRPARFQAAEGHVRKLMDLLSRDR